MGKTVILAFTSKKLKKIIEETVEKENIEELIIVSRENVSVNIHEKNKIKTRIFFKNFYDFFSHQEVEKLKWDVVSLIESLPETETFRELSFYEGFNLWDAAEFMIFRVFFEAAMAVKLTKKILDIVKPSKIIVVEGNETPLFWEDVTGHLTSALLRSEVTCYSSIVSQLVGDKKIEVVRITPNPAKTFLYKIVRRFIPWAYRILFQLRGWQRKIEASPVEKPGELPVEAISILRGDYPALTLIPVFHAMKKRNLNMLIIRADGLLSNRAKHILQNENIPYINYEKYLVNIAREKVRKASKNLVKEWKQLSRKRLKAPTFEGVNLSTFMAEKLNFLFSVLFPLIMLNFEAATTIIKTEKPAVVVLLDDLPILERVFARAAGKNGVPVIVVPYATFPASLPPIPLSATVMAVWGDHMKKNLMDKRRARLECFKVCGHPGLEYRILKVSEIRREDFLRKLKIDGKKPIILFTSHYATSTLNLEALYETAKKLENVHFIVKLHPLESFKRHIDLINRLQLGNVSVIRDIDLYLLIRFCDFLITCDALTTAVEAIALNKPLILFDLTNEMDYTSYREKGVALTPKSREELIETVENMLFNPSLKEKMAQARNSFLHEYFYKIDGKSAERIANLIEKFILEKKKGTCKSFNADESIKFRQGRL